jgi:predicted dehydrogenase
MSDALRAGLVGCGSLAQRGVLPHLSQPDAQERVRLVAVADAVAERAQQTAARFGVPAHFASIEAMLEAVELDMVLVLTPIPFHYANALAAIEAGKHVYVQKALTTTLAEADALLAARDRAGVRLAAAPGYELFPATAQMRAIVDEGRLGRVCMAYTYTMGFGHEHEPIRAGEGQLAAIDPSWYYRPGAGPLPDVTVYSLQLATSVLGPVRRVTALANTIRPQRTWRGSTITIEIEDNNVLLMEFASGALVVAAGSDCRGNRRTPWGGLTIYGTTGVLDVTAVDNNSGYPTDFELQAGRDAPRGFSVALTEQPYLTPAHLALEEPHVYVDIMDLADAVREGRAPRAGGEQARHVVEVIERGRAAARTGQAQELVSAF